MDKNDEINGISGAHFTLERVRAPEYPPMSIDISTTTEINIGAWFKHVFADCGPLTPTFNKITIDGAEALEYVDPVTEGGCSTYYVTNRKNIFYGISGSASCDSEDPTQHNEHVDFMRVLSSFKFLDRGAAF